jgi:transcriptional regulator with XRE-family HTH domain
MPDPRWWTEGVVDGRPMSDVLAARDIGAVFRFLRGKGWSLTAMCAATGLKETRIRAVMNGVQRITSYEVLVRVALGLRIPRGAMGLAYTTTGDGGDGAVGLGDVGA